MIGVDKAAVSVQPIVRLKALSLGAAGQAWLSGLPDLVAELEHRWSISVEESLGGGTAAYVARTLSSDGRSFILKVSVPDPDFADEIGTLSRAQGRGYVRLFAEDIGQRAMLIEALGPSMDRSGMPPQEQIRTLCRLLTQAWQVPPAETGAAAQDKATGLAALVSRLWEELDRPCTEQALDEALLFAARRAAALQPDRCVLVHGDAAPSNALQVLEPRAGAETGFVFVDPDGFVGDPAYDLGVALRDWSPQLLSSKEPQALAHHYCQLLAAGSGFGEQEIWEWGYLERVSTGLYALAMGADDLGQVFLDTAEMLV